VQPTEFLLAEGGERPRGLHLPLRFRSLHPSDHVSGRATEEIEVPAGDYIAKAYQPRECSDDRRGLVAGLAEMF